MKTAIIGCGRIAQLHAAILESMEGAQVVACVDTAPDKAQAMAAPFGAKAYSDYLEMMDTEKPDLVHLCTPHYLHVEMAMEALARGIHVLMEKPAAISPESFKRLVKAQERSSALIGICFQNRYNATVRHLAQRLEEGQLGAIRGARCFVTWSRGADYYMDDWHGKAATEGGGVLINQAIHSMDLLVHLLGKPSRVQASTHNRHLQGVIEVEDTMEAYIEFGQRPALFYASLAHCTDAPVLLDIVCEQATCGLQGDHLTIRHNDGQVEDISAAQLQIPGKSYWGSSHKLIIADFYDAVSNNKPFALNPRDITQTMNLVFACYQSAASGQAISL